MTSRLPLTFTLALGLFALASCEEESTPTQPGAAGEGPSTGSAAVPAGNTWTARARILTAREQLAAGVADNPAGQPIVYVFGGIDPIEGFPTPTIEAYNYATNTWATKTTSFTPARSNGVGRIGGKLYISGGILDSGDGLVALPTLYAYDPTRDVLTRKADMPRQVADGITGVIGGKLYVLTGTCDNCTHFFTSRLYRYDPASNTWTTSLPWSPHLHHGGAGGVIKGKFYVTGGEMVNGATPLDVYDPVANRWTTMAPLPDVPAGPAGAVVHNKLYVIGGAGPNGNRRVYRYDPATNTWKTRASLITGRFRLAAARVTVNGQSRILALGGFNDADTTSASANEAYRP